MWIKGYVNIFINVMWFFVVAVVGFTQEEYTVPENQDADVTINLQNTLAVSVSVR